MTLYWNQLLSDKRRRETTSIKRSDNDKRSAFKKDFDTVCNSTILRRLQDKAQVFPLENEDYARTRLTHSIEVMSIAESLGVQTIDIIRKQDPAYLCQDKTQATDILNLVQEIPTILKTVALLHDMGNPPFGHLGEQIIGDWFRDNLGNLAFNSDRTLVYKTGSDPKDTLEYILKGPYAEDLIHFEGNAQLFRLVNKLNFVVDEYGMNLSYPVMSAFIKYPTSSLKISKDTLLTKKMGFFTSEADIFKDIDEHLGLHGSRHPLAFLLEAADDIAYLTADIEDAHRKGLISLNTIKDYFQSHESDPFIGTVLSQIDVYEQAAKDIKYNDIEDYVIHRTRVLIKGLMIDAVYSAFNDAYVEIMNGTFSEELLEKSAAKEITHVLRKIEKDNIYYSPQILQNKTKAFSVIKKLLEIYVPAVINWKSKRDDNKDTSNNLLYQSLSKNYRYVCEQANIKAEAEGKSEAVILYNKLHLVTDQISGMTDTHALSVYHTITAR